MIASLAAVGLAPGGGTSQREPPPIVDESPLPDETPTGLVTFEAPEDTIDASEEHQAVITTDRGQIVVALNPDAPQAANSFAFLAEQGFYDGLEFFWVVPGFDVQTGDPTCEESGEYSCTGTGDPGYDLPTEGDSTQADKWTVIAPFTPAGERVHGSQFVITLTAEGEFEGSVIGEVIEGQDILESLEERIPCFGSDPSDSNPCQTEEELPSALIIEGVVIEPA